jgi:hypothetical protein
MFTMGDIEHILNMQKASEVKQKHDVHECICNKSNKDLS